jgi:hypothetical protein
VHRLPEQVRYRPLGQKAILRRIGLRGLDPALFDRHKSGFVLPFDRWIRRGLKDAMDETLRDPQAIAPAGLDPAACAALAGLPRRGTRHVLVTGVVRLCLHPMVPPQSRLPLSGLPGAPGSVLDHRGRRPRRRVGGGAGRRAAGSGEGLASRR